MLETARAAGSEVKLDSKGPTGQAVPLFTAQLLGMTVGPPFSFRLIWVAAITTMLYYSLR